MHMNRAYTHKWLLHIRFQLTINDTIKRYLCPFQMGKDERYNNASCYEGVETVLTRVKRTQLSKRALGQYLIKL